MLPTVRLHLTSLSLSLKAFLLNPTSQSLRHPHPHPPHPLPILPTKKPNRPKHNTTQNGPQELHHPHSPRQRAPHPRFPLPQREAERELISLPFKSSHHIHAQRYHPSIPNITNTRTPFIDRLRPPRRQSRAQRRKVRFRQFRPLVQQDPRRVEEGQQRRWRR